MPAKSKAQRRFACASCHNPKALRGRTAMEKKAACELCKSGLKRNAPERKRKRTNVKRRNR